MLGRCRRALGIRGGYWGGVGVRGGSWGCWLRGEQKASGWAYDPIAQAGRILHLRELRRRESHMPEFCKSCEQGFWKGLSDED